MRTMGEPNPSYRLAKGLSAETLLGTTLAPLEHDDRLAGAAEQLADEIQVLTKYVIADAGETDSAIFERTALGIETRLRALAALIRKTADEVDLAEDGLDAALRVGVKWPAGTTLAQVDVAVTRALAERAELRNPQGIPAATWEARLLELVAKVAPPTLPPPAASVTPRVKPRSARRVRKVPR
jgi:hypothetical protein